LIPDLPSGVGAIIQRHAPVATAGNDFCVTLQSDRHYPALAAWPDPDAD
jgi:hypothetical protein